MNRKLKFLFVQSEHENIGLEYLASTLKSNGHQVELSFFPRPFENGSFNIGKEDIDKENLKLETEFLKVRPDVVGFSVYTAHYQWAVRKAKYLKERFGCFILFGGIHATSVPEVVIDEDCVDAIIIGESEEAICDFANNYFSENLYNINNLWIKKNGSTYKNSLRALNQNLDVLPFPDKAIFYDKFPKKLVKGSTYTILSGRGCPFTCTYCCNDVYSNIYRGQNRVRFRSPEKIIDEISLNVEKYGFSRVDFMDDVFALNIDRLELLLPLYSKHINLPFVCFLHPKIVTEDMIKLLRTHGCAWLKIGVQSASETYRREYLNRLETNENIIRVADWCKKYRLRFSLDHIFNLPGENEQSLLDAIDLYNRCRPEIINFGNLLYFPKTKIIETGLKEKAIGQADIDLINKGMHTFSIQSDIDRFRAKRKLNKPGINTSVFILFFILISIFPSGFIRFLKQIKLYEIKFNMPSFIIIFLKIISKFKAGQGYLYISALKYSLYWGKKRSQNY